MTPPMKPYKIVKGEYPDWYDIIDRATGVLAGSIYRADLPWGVQWEAYSGKDAVGIWRTRTLAAHAVYQAWLDRTSEGSKK